MTSMCQHDQSNTGRLWMLKLCSLWPNMRRQPLDGAFRRHRVVPPSADRNAFVTGHGLWSLHDQQIYANSILSGNAKCWLHRFLSSAPCSADVRWRVGL